MRSDYLLRIPAFAAALVSILPRVDGFTLRHGADGSTRQSSSAQPQPQQQEQHGGSVSCLASSSSSKSPVPSETNQSSSFESRSVAGPPLHDKPDYESIVGPLGKPVDNLFLRVFRSQLAANVGFDSKLPQSDYQGILEITSELNKKYSDRAEIQRTAQETLRSLFPSWLPGSYAVLFSKPFPKFSARMNAWATWWAGTWLMGECEINDVIVDDGKEGPAQGLLVKRCRFLEEAGCASVCVNSCKIPTQKFFNEDMGLPLTMEPNYETFECQFSFGKTPTIQTEMEAINTPCLMRCPTAGSLREWHMNGSGAPPKGACELMENND